MADVVTTLDLAAWLRDLSLSDNPSLVQIVALTNELVGEEWADPVDPIPVKVRLLGLNVASRAWVNDPSRANVESVSRALDDASRTERYRTSLEHGGVYLTAAEAALLNGARQTRSVRLVNYGQF